MGRRANDLTGRQFGNLTVVTLAGKKGGNRRWLCRCKCGRELEVWQPNLLNGRSRGCGCEMAKPGRRHYAEGTCLEMISSQTVFKNNKSGVRGVYWKANRGKWAAQITFQGRTHYLGLYTTLEDASTARKQAEQQYYGSFLASYNA